MKRNKSLCGFGFSGFPVFALATLFLFGHFILIAQEQKSPRPALPPVQSVNVKGIKFELASIPAGEFQMGSDTGDVLEKTAHHVRVGSFQLARTEVMVRLFRAGDWTK